MKPAQAQRLARPEPEPRDGEARVVGAIQEGLADVQAGRVVDDEELDEVLRAPTTLSKERVMGASTPL